MNIVHETTSGGKTELVEDGNPYTGVRWKRAWFVNGSNRGFHSNLCRAYGDQVYLRQLWSFHGPCSDELSSIVHCKLPIDLISLHFSFCIYSEIPLWRIASLVICFKCLHSCKTEKLFHSAAVSSVMIWFSDLLNRITANDVSIIVSTMASFGWGSVHALGLLSLENSQGASAFFLLRFLRQFKLRSLAPNQFSET